MTWVRDRMLEAKESWGCFDEAVCNDPDFVPERWARDLFLPRLQPYLLRRVAEADMFIYDANEAGQPKDAKYEGELHMHRRAIALLHQVKELLEQDVDVYACAEVDGSLVSQGRW